MWTYTVSIQVLQGKWTALLVCITENSTRGTDCQAIGEAMRPPRASWRPDKPEAVAEAQL